VIALDFAPNMVKTAKKHLGDQADQVEFRVSAMHDLQDLAGSLDVAVAVNSIVMPDVREIDRTMSAIFAALRPGGRFLGILPAMDAIHYQTMLLYDRALRQGLEIEEAERQAAFLAEHHYYDFAFGRFQYQGLRQKFWEPFEARHRLEKAGFVDIRLEQVLYPWDDHLAGFEDFAAMPRSWDWFFAAGVPSGTGGESVAGRDDKR
jgi:SAM-dependent methyltransferase